MKGFAKFAAPLHRLVAVLGGTTSRCRAEQSVGERWIKECNRSFKALKTKLTTAPVLAYADFSLRFVLEVDTSFVGLVPSLMPAEG